MNPALLEDVKNYLDITWKDELTDKKIGGMIFRSIAYLNDLTHSDLDYEAEGQARELLFLRVMYDRSGALDDFRKNYLSDLNALVKSERIKKMYAEGE